MARPRKTAATLVVEIDGELIAFTDGILKTENPATEALIRQEARMGSVIPVTFFGPEVAADLDPKNPLGNLAAMVSPSPGRARILEAPDGILTDPSDAEDN